MENEQKEISKEDSLPTLNELVERLEKANADAKVIQTRNEELAARNLLGGKTDSGIQSNVPVETAKEYKNKIMRGEVKFTE